MKAATESTPAEYAFPRDDGYGFAGALRGNYDLGWRANARLWRVACEAVEAAFRETDRRIVRHFLRSRYGRHLADDLSRRMGRDPEEADARQAIVAAHWQKDWAKGYREVAAATRRGEWDNEE